MVAPPGLRRREYDASGLETNVFPSNAEDLADPKASDGGEPDRSYGPWMLLVGAVQRGGKCNDLGGEKDAIARFLSRALDATCGIRVL